MFWIFMGFWVPVIPNGFSIYLGQKIISMVRKEPDTYTGEIFGWFAILFTLAQLAGWVYIFAVIMGWAPPPESTRPIMP